MSFYFSKVIASAAEFERAAQSLAKTLSISFEEAKERLRADMQESVQRVVYRANEHAADVDLTPFVRDAMLGSDVPIHPGNRRTIRLAGKPKHFEQVGNQLRLRDGESPWT